MANWTSGCSNARSSPARETFASTNNDADSSITIEVEVPNFSTFYVLNRMDCCMDRINGCELQLLDASGKILLRQSLSVPDVTKRYAFFFSRFHAFQMALVEVN